MSMGLQEALRIDIDLELEVSLGLGSRGEPVPQIIRQVETAGGFQQQPEPIASLDDGERRFRRPQDLNPIVAWRGRGQSSCEAFRAGPVARRYDQTCKPA